MCLSSCPQDLTPAVNGSAGKGGGRGPSPRPKPGGRSGTGSASPHCADRVRCSLRYWSVPRARICCARSAARGPCLGRCPARCADVPRDGCRDGVVMWVGEGDGRRGGARLAHTRGVRWAERRRGLNRWPTRSPATSLRVTAGVDLVLSDDMAFSTRHIGSNGCRANWPNGTRIHGEHWTPRGRRPRATRSRPGPDAPSSYRTC